MNKRRHQRIEVKNIVAKLSNGVDSFSGTVSNISRVGMLLADTPQELSSHEEKMSIIVSAKGKDYKMMVVPKWTIGNNSDNKMGLAILDEPLDWAMFVMNYEQTDEDIWAATTHLPDY